MGLWSKGLNRNKTGKVRSEENLTSLIEYFFNNQKEKVSYEVVDYKNWIVNVDGNLYINQSDLDEGNLFFKIGNLTGNLYFHGKYMSPSVIPDQMEGDIIFVPDEEELARTRGQKGNSEDELDMGLLRAQPTQEQMYKKLEEVISEMVYYGYDFDFDALKRNLKEELSQKDKYKLKIEFDKKTPSSAKHICKIYVDDTDKPIKLTPIETAVYLTFMLFEDGIKPDYLTPKFYKRIRGIYKNLSDTVQDWSDTSGGILVKEFDLLTLNGHRSNIRKAIKTKIANKRIIDDFAVEGEKGNPFKVAKATDEIRNQIKSTFGVQ